MERKILKITIIFIVFILSSCVSNRKFVYFQNKDQGKTPAEFEIHKSQYLISPDDELYITINSFDNQQYSAIYQRSTGFNIPDITLLTYTVSKAGYIRLPLIDSIKVEGLTAIQASSKIEEKLTAMLNRPSVSVKVANRSVTVLGYVRVPGKYNFAKEDMTIFQALGLAGDIVDYGNKNKVLLIREKNDKKVEKVYLDLTKEDIINSEYYYVKNDDVIFVEPLKRKQWGFREFPTGLVLSGITTAILLYRFIKTDI